MLLKLIVYCRLLLLQNVFPCLVHGAPVSVDNFNNVMTLLTAWEDGKDPEFESSAAASVMPSWKDILWLPDDASSNRFQAPGSATGRMFSNNYWNQSGNCVPYAIAPDFDAEAQHLIRTALLAIENATHGCVRFIKREHEKEFISIQHKPGCAADVGRTPRRITKVILGGNCLSPRTIIHEIFHALGFYHEHSRPDRDTYVTVNAAPSNIERNVDLRNFNILPDMPVFNLPYDYDSIMHYAPSDFAANPNDPNGAVIMPKVNGSLKIGKRDQLSVLDIARLKVAYGCLDANLGPIRKTFPNNCKMTVKVAERVEEPVVSAVRHQHSPTSRKPKGSRLRELNEVPRYVEDNNAESPFLPEFSDKLMTNEQCAAQFTSNCSPVQRKKAACARFRGLEIHCYNTATLEEIAQITAAVSRPPIRAVRIRLNDGPLITYRNFVRVSTQVVQFTLSFCRGARASAADNLTGAINNPHTGRGDLYEPEEFGGVVAGIWTGESAAFATALS
ncbi:astacin-like metalloendopeptidase [Paramacrobiotus metropolitanus]|uniref:astacin-like metalloendopeptidase n=1 Tax=Paramacrobiotus metropolitanus TaxID=2943436 RepID=UPI002445F30E|nr:astacin-like metalloendopeptidase [Paramacrobiotus metropolitanus]